MQPKRLYWALSAASANDVCLSQTPGGAGNLVLNGARVVAGVAVMSNGDPTVSSGGASQRRLLFTFAGNEAARTFTVFGTRAGDGFGAAKQVVIGTVAGTAPGTVETDFDLATVTRIAVDAATAGALTVGTSTKGSTPWVMANLHAAALQKINVDGYLVSGAATTTLEYTADPLPKLFTAADNTRFPRVRTHPGWSAITGDGEGVIDWPISAFRLTQTGTGLFRLVYIGSPTVGN